MMQFTAASPHGIEKAFSKALFAAREQVLTDCNYFVRVDQGTLRDTAYTEVDGMTMKVIYNQPYAKKVYYTGKPSHNENANASLQWCEVARGQYGKQWQEILQKGMNE
jgi:hypothetical protein